MEKVIGIKELHGNLKTVSEMVASGIRYIVVKNSKPIFRIEPFEDKTDQYQLKDFKKLQFKAKGEKNLSKNIDKTLYNS